MTNLEVYYKRQRCTQKIAFGTSGNALNRQEYIGWALPGTGTDAQGWLIMKMTYDSSGRQTDIKWANSESDKFDKIWDSKGDYTYG